MTLQSNAARNGRNRIRSKSEMKKILFVIAFCTLPLLNFLIFYVFVNAQSFLMAFQRVRGNGDVYFTLANFTRFFGEFTEPTSEIGISLRNTFITFGVLLLLFPIGFLVSYFLYKRIFGYKVIRALFFLPSVLAGTIVTTFYVNVVGVDGPIAKLVQNIMNLPYVPSLLSDSRFANLFVFLNLIWLSIPGDMIIWGGTLSRISQSVLEAAELDGVGWFREAWQIILPLVWPTFAMKLLLLVVGVFGSTGNVFLLTRGDSGTMTLNCWMYLQVYETGGNIRSNSLYYLSAVGVMITAVAVVLALVVKKITDLLNADVSY